MVTGTDLNIWCPVQIWRWDVLPVNTQTRIYDAVKGVLLENHTTGYDTDMMRPTEQTTYHGNNYQRLTYAYDNWGNISFIKDYSLSNGRVNQTKTWMYHLGVSNPSSEDPWLGSPYSQPALTRERHNLPVGKVVANYVPVKDGEPNCNLIYIPIINITNLANRPGAPSGTGSKWLFTKYEYHPLSVV